MFWSLRHLLKNSATYLYTLSVQEEHRPCQHSGSLREKCPNVYSPGVDKIDCKRMYTEVAFSIGSGFIRLALDNSAPIADLQGSNKRIPYCQILTIASMQHRSNTAIQTDQFQNYVLGEFSEKAWNSDATIGNGVKGERGEGDTTDEVRALLPTLEKLTPKTKGSRKTVASLRKATKNARMTRKMFFANFAKRRTKTSEAAQLEAVFSASIANCGTMSAVSMLFSANNLYVDYGYQISKKTGDPSYPTGDPIYPTFCPNRHQAELHSFVYTGAGVVFSIVCCTDVKPRSYELNRATGMQGQGNGRSLSKSADQRHRQARFPPAKIRGVTPQVRLFILCTNVPISTAHWLSAVIVEGDDWNSVLHGVSTPCGAMARSQDFSADFLKCSVGVRNGQKVGPRHCYQKNSRRVAVSFCHDRFALDVALRNTGAVVRINKTLGRLNYPKGSVAKRLPCWHPSQAIRVHYTRPGQSWNFASGNRADPFSPHFTIISSRDLMRTLAGGIKDAVCYWCTLTGEEKISRRNKMTTYSRRNKMAALRHPRWRVRPKVREVLSTE
ncbi:hypothetical protein PR048_012106 [Dryococelus australis]|uniref:Uncharacterized protein n=1 Tax=Dryococelus australis TaxID=614101 RepID=A0ABQ9HNE8_9NEOP|nr:hypothetical protein PR048_012106 [Dryococelus australis]